MVRDWTFGRKVGAGFAMTAVALVVIAVTGYRSIEDMRANEARVSHTHQVRAALASLLAALGDAESGQRGYVLSGSEAFLEPYRTGVPRIDREYTELRRLSVNNAERLRRLDQLRPLLDARIGELKNVVEQRRTAPEAATAAVTGGPGLHTMAEIRELIADLDRDVVELLARRHVAAEDSAATATAVILYGSLAALALTVIAGWWITRALSRQLGSAAQQMQSASTELQAAANQQASGSSEQASAMTEIATTINELLATSRQIADSAQRVAQIASQTAGAARAGDATVTRGSDASATVRKQVDQIVTHMLDLGERSQQMGVVLDLVSELAEQTNILAINATIEAAGAGEAGRRFGVVADEIRKLADRVAASTKEIRAMVDGVRGAVNTTVMATEAGSKAVDSGAAQVLEMASAFRQIAGLVVTTTEAAREIELSTKQQTTAVEQVNIAISSVAQAARETEASATQTLQTSSQLAGLSRELLRIVSARTQA